MTKFIKDIPYELDRIIHQKNVHSLLINQRHLAKRVQWDIRERMKISYNGRFTI
jgi:hypothetical protein